MSIEDTPEPGSETTEPAEKAPEPADDKKEPRKKSAAEKQQEKDALINLWIGNMDQDKPDGDGKP